MAEGLIAPFVSWHAIRPRRGEREPRPGVEYWVASLGSIPEGLNGAALLPAPDSAVTNDHPVRGNEQPERP